MIQINNEMVSMFDVDETLVITPEDDAPFEIHKDKLIMNPYDKKPKHRRVHRKHVELLKQMYGRGRMIGVWSGGGVQWAKAVIEALGIEPYVHLVMTKPICYVDDYPASQWLNNQVYLKADK